MTENIHPAGASGRSWRESRWLRASLLALLFALAVGLHARTRAFEFVSLDDHVYVYANPHLEAGLGPGGWSYALTTFHGDQWHPVTWLTHLFDVEVHGLDAGGHHLTSVLLFGATAVLVALALAVLTGAFWPALLAAAFFALHPLRVESVAWVAERKDVLCALFWAATLLAYGVYVRQGGARRYLLVAVLCALALGSKGMAMTLPFVLLLLDRWPLARPEPWRRLVLEKVPLFLLAAGTFALDFVSSAGPRSVTSIADLGLPVRLANALLSYVRYLQDILWPRELACPYPHPGIVDPEFAPLGAPILLAGLVLVLVTALALSLRRRSPQVLMGWLWFLGTLVPAIGLLQAGDQARADRFAYIPSLGITIAVVWGARDLMRAWRPAAALLPVLAVALLLFLSVASRRQNLVWRNSRALYEHALVATERNYVAHNNLGIVLESEGDRDGAETHYRAALAILPEHPDALTNLGKVLAETGRREEARALYGRAIAAEPRVVAARCNLGVLRMEARDYPGARTLFEEALELAPDHVLTRKNLVLVLETGGDPAPLIPHLETLVELDPGDLWSLERLGRAYTSLGDRDAALYWFGRALEVAPPERQEVLRGWIESIRAQ